MRYYGDASPTDSTDDDSTKKKSHKTLYIGLGVGAAVLLLIAIFFYMKRKKGASSF